MARKVAVAIVAGVVVVAGAALALTVGRGNGSSAAGPSSGLTPATTSPPATSTVRPAPTTARTSAAPTVGAAGGDGAGSTEPGKPIQPSNATNVSVTYAGWVRSSEQVEVNAFASVVENGGTCTLLITSAAGADRRTTTAQASADATTTICGQLTINSTTMTSGTWTATVTYSSPTHKGQSAASEVVVTR